MSDVKYIEQTDDRVCGWCGHAFDCSHHEAPLYDNGECNCGYVEGKGVPVIENEDLTIESADSDPIKELYLET